MRTILITGGAGFIGSNFARHLYQKYPDYRLVIVDMLTYAGSVQNLSPDLNQRPDDRVQFWYGNIRNGELIDSLVSQSDVIVHFAAESHVTRSIYDNQLFFETDVLGTQTIANAVVKYKSRVERFIHISTSEVYGTAVTDKMDEDHPLYPMSPYASAKCGADRLVYSYWATYGIPAIIVRPFNVFGPYQHLEKAIPRFITSCLLGEPLTVHGDGAAARDWMFVSNLCEGLDRLLAEERDRVVGQVINFGTGRHRSVLEVAEAVREAVGAPHVSIRRIGDRPGQVFRHTCDASKAKRLLGWEPHILFEEGLRQTIDWYQTNEAWWRPQLWMRHIPIVTASGKQEMH
jgi:dTDP-glucose 4,6-dehydratase